MTEQVLWAAEGLNAAIGNQILYADADFAVHASERVGLVGRNGCGKSTLLRMIAGGEQPASGAITRARGLRTALLAQNFEPDGARTIAENVADGLAWFREMQHQFETLPVKSAEHAHLEHLLLLHDGWNLESKLDRVLEELGLQSDRDRLCHNLSGGEKRRVAFARTVISEPDLLLLDEPTNHLDIATVEWIESFLGAWRGSCLFVTHDRCFLDRIATRIVELDHGKFYSYNGSYAEFLAAKAEREANEDILEAKRRSFLRSEIEWVRRSPKARLRRNLGRLKRFNEISAIRAPQRDGEMELLIPPAGRLGNKTVELKDVSITLGGREIISHFSFEIEPGSRLGVIGPNGIGKSTLLKLITGEKRPDSGEVKIAETVEFNYIDQSRLVLDPEKTVAEEIGEGCESVRLGTEKISIWGYLKRFLFEDERINTRIRYLSGGEKARLTLAKILKNGGNFLVLDEPTNDLDLSSLRLLEEALAAYRGCVLVVSHDRYFLNRVCTGLLGFESDGTILYTPGDYDYYDEKRKDRERAAAAAAAASEPVPLRNNSATRNTAGEKPSADTVKPVTRKLSWREERELENMENAVENAENAVQEIEACFGDPDFFNKYGARTVELQTKLDEARAKVNCLYARWEELEAKRAAATEGAG